MENAAAGGACDNNGGKLCDGQGRCVECLAPEDCQGDELCEQNHCIPPWCADGQQDHDETGVDCGGGSCPACANGKACLQAPDCQSLFCDHQGGSGGSASGDPGVCSVCTNEDDCAEAPLTYCKAGSCVPKKMNGDICVGANECQSGACPGHDGVCCNVACDQICKACLAAKTGLATGSCGAVVHAEDPDGECDDLVGPVSCGANGTGCNGDTNAPGCIFYKSGTQCGAADCANGAQTQAQVCDGLGSCVAQSPLPCSPYVCDLSATTCLTACQGDGDCVLTHYCDGNHACRVKQPNGEGCTATNQCQSGFCPVQDLVCCDSACDSTCEACVQGKTGSLSGTCAHVTNKTDPDDECGVPQPCCNGNAQCTSMCL
jgi:hypothetical protein